MSKYDFQFEPEVLKRQIKLPKGIFSLPPPLLELYSDNSLNLVVMKGSQAFVTTFAFLNELLYARYFPYPLTIIHAFPTTELAKQQTERLDQLIKINGWVGGARGSKLLKKIINKPTGLNSIIIINGVSTDRAVISTDADFIITDEFDRAIDPELVREFESRTLASRLAKKMIISVPYAGQGYGINLRFLESTQNYWFVKCRSCHKEVPLADIFWEINSDPPFYFCPECKKPLDPDDPEAVEVRRTGRYKPLNPGAKVQGYHISRLLYPEVKLSELVLQYPDADDLFWYTWIGGFPSSVETVVVKEVPLEFGEFEGLAFLGIDVSISDYIVAVGLKTDKGFVIREVRHIPVNKAEEGFYDLIENYNVQGIVCDSYPEHSRSATLLQMLDVPFYFVKYGQFQIPDWLSLRGDTYLVQKWEALRRFILAVKDKDIRFHKDAKLAAEEVAGLRPAKLRQVYTWKETGRCDELHAAVYAWLGLSVFSTAELASGEEMDFEFLL